MDSGMGREANCGDGRVSAGLVYQPPEKLGAAYSGISKLEGAEPLDEGIGIGGGETYREERLG